MSKTKKYWTGLDQLHNTPEFQESAGNEFAPGVAGTDLTGKNLLESENLDEGSTKRRDFLKFLGFSVGAATLAACEAPVNKAIPYLNKPEEITPGVPNYYASTFFDGTDYASILVKTREGRPIKVVGNKKSKLTGGALNARVNSSVLGLYDSARATGPMKGGETTDWATVDKEVGAALAKLGEAGGSIVILTETIISPSTKKAIAEFAVKYGAGVKHVTYDALSASGSLEANLLCFGVKALPVYDFAAADVVVSFGADFIAGFPNGAANAVGYGKMRDPKSGMSRHFQFESNMSLAGSNADVRVALKPSESTAAIISLYNKVATATGGNTLSGGTSEYDATIAKAAKELVAAKGKGIVVSNSNDAGVQTVVNAINNLLGNYGTTLNMANPLYIKGGVDAEMNQLVADMKDGKVGALLIHGVNPSYSYAKAADFNAGLAKVGLTVSFADRLDETAAAGVTYLAPDNHYLESWNDSEPQAGSYSLTQPTIQPLFDTRQFQESLLKWSGNDSDYFSYIKANWAGIHTSSPDAGLLFSNFFNTALFNGVFESGTVGETPAFVGDVAAAAGAIKKVPAGEFELELYVKAGMGDGSQANNPWLQELPDPISRVTWDNYITMSPKQMQEMGFSRLERGDFMANVAELTANGSAIKVPVYPSPGQKYGTVGLAVGYGRTAAGKCGNEVGVNAFVLSSGSFAVGAVTVTNTGAEHEIAQTQSHHTLMGRDSILKETTLAEYKQDPKSGNPDLLLYVSSAGSSAGHGDSHGGGHGEEGHAEAAHEEHASPFLPASEVNLWNDHAINSGHRWGMSIDLNKCIGCGACVTGCGSENNVPVVGKEEVRRGRDMHWLRIDRYYSSDMDEERAEAEGVGAIDKFTLMEAAAEAPQVAYQPVMCQHCNHAPCETVCPVAATTHSDEGLNMMTYNRCIGTRYCANNCPYKVRRFNWFQYHNGSKDFSKNPANDDLGRMVLNPDVVVRDRGVMEKCSFCVQGIQAAKLAAKKAGRKVANEEVQSACAEACPTNAIVFGDLNDKESWVAANAKDERSYHLLEEVGVQPNVVYMTKVRNVEENEA
ncbi:MAG: TAT-variant-translocated molybdopterin oxidoreductase [Flavobacteriales bacterium]|nr:TAT-variant-translocated molybdopterin oxidoreductase [Flavobacteriales bacterium]